MKAISIFLLPAVLFVNFAYSQGCSDAGFCTVGSLSQNYTDTTLHRGAVSLVLSSGAGDEGVFIFTPAIQYDHKFSEKFAMQTKLTANYASGDLGSVFGAGDVYTLGIFTPGIVKERNFTTSFTVGFKIPLNKSDLAVEQEVLPMVYQSSLGTLDLITGLSVSTSHWQFSVGWQQPLTGSNENTYESGLPDIGQYPPTNMFKRKADVLVRTVYSTNLKKGWRVNGGLLGIYHMGNDTYKSAMSDMGYMSLRGSKGLTLNVTAGMSWMLGGSWSVGFTSGVPLVVRDIRPDGLTRSFVFAPELKYRL